MTGLAAAEPAGSPGRRTGPGTTPGQTGCITATRAGSAAGHRPVRNTILSPVPGRPVIGGHERGESPGRRRSERRAGVRLCEDVLAARRGEGNATYRPQLRLHLDPGYCDCRDRAGGGPLPIQPLPSDTQFAQTMPELGRPHRYMSAAPNPRILTGWSGASSHGLRFPLAGFPPVSRLPTRLFPFVRRLRVSPRPAFSGSVLRPSLSGSAPRRFPPGSLPLEHFHVSAAAGRICRRWSRAGATKVTSGHQYPARSLAPIVGVTRNADVPRERTGSRGTAGRPAR